MSKFLLRLEFMHVTVQYKNISDEEQFVPCNMMFKINAISTHLSENKNRKAIVLLDSVLKNIEMETVSQACFGISAFEHSLSPPCLLPQSASHCCDIYIGFVNEW